jgi:hypothetical protein
MAVFPAGQSWPDTKAKDHRVHVLSRIGRTIACP